jgi:hypothetical protein
MKRLALLSPLLLGGCMMSNVVNPAVVEKFGGADLACSTVRVEQLTDTTWRATGCDQQAVYTCWTSPGMGEGMCTKAAP